jgi:hypothetical protein
MYQKYKKIIWGVVIVLALFVLYSIFFKKSPEPALTQASAAGTTAADEELIALLNQVKGIDLNSAIFSNELFLSLTNYSVELVPEPKGRTNPFAPIGIGDIVPPPSGTSSSTTPASAGSEGL